MSMLFLDIVVWWYGRGWFERIQDSKQYVLHWSRFLSLGTLFLTLFQPWKQIVTNPNPNGGLAAKKDALIDNIISRFVGFLARSFVLAFGVILLMSVFVLSIAWMLVWPFLPVLPLILIVLGLSI